MYLQLDDEEAAKEEEAEALRLQRKEAEALRPEDFEQPSEDESEPEAEDGADAEEAGTLGAAAARVSLLPVCWRSHPSAADCSARQHITWALRQLQPCQPQVCIFISKCIASMSAT